MEQCDRKEKIVRISEKKALMDIRIEWIASLVNLNNNFNSRTETTVTGKFQISLLLPAKPRLFMKMFSIGPAKFCGYFFISRKPEKDKIYVCLWPVTMYIIKRKS